MSHLRLHRPRFTIAMVLGLIGVFFFVTSAQARVGVDNERILAITTDPSDGAAPTVLGWGPIHAKGTDRVISDTKDQFVFPRGSIYVTHHPQGSSQSSDRATCTFRFREHGWYRVTGGTGAYAGAAGHGRYRLQALGVGCDHSAPPETFVLQIHAYGPLSI